MKCKRGFTLIEIAAAIAVLAACAVTFVQLATLITSERIAERTRQTATDQLQNVLERLAATEPEKLAAGDFDKVPFESLIERSLPDGKIIFETKIFKPDNVMLTVTVSWSDGEKRPRKKVAMFRLLYPHPHPLPLGEGTDDP